VGVGEDADLTTRVTFQVEGPRRRDGVRLADAVDGLVELQVRRRVVEARFSIRDDEHDLGVVEDGPAAVRIRGLVFLRDAHARGALHGVAVEAGGVEVT